MFGFRHPENCQGTLFLPYHTHSLHTLAPLTAFLSQHQPLLSNCRINDPLHSILCALTVPPCSPGRRWRPSLASCQEEPSGHCQLATKSRLSAGHSRSSEMNHPNLVHRAWLDSRGRVASDMAPLSNGVHSHLASYPSLPPPLPQFGLTLLRACPSTAHPH